MIIKEFAHIALLYMKALKPDVSIMSEVSCARDFPLNEQLSHAGFAKLSFANNCSFSPVYMPC